MPIMPTIMPTRPWQPKALSLMPVLLRRMLDPSTELVAELRYAGAIDMNPAIVVSLWSDRTGYRQALICADVGMAMRLLDIAENTRGAAQLPPWALPLALTPESPGGLRP